jgi:hypothetical protein
MRMVDNPVGEIYERVADVQALLDDHIAGGKHSAADVVCEGASRAVGSRAAAGDNWPPCCVDRLRSPGYSNRHSSGGVFGGN